MRKDIAGGTVGGEKTNSERLPFGEPPKRAFTDANRLLKSTTEEAGGGHGEFVSNTPSFSHQ